ncbi:uncharacterized protein [Clytia hemisphaerica]|uniref:non-specific serine/threonine protein kinase n=1 Tax=Clytia hemisphaerica TaxID=252671 RepID=A0A7M5WVV7_9CNID
MEIDGGLKGSMVKITKRAKQRLIKRKSNVNAKKLVFDAVHKKDVSLKEKQEILWATSECDREDILEELLQDTQIDINLTDENGHSAIFHAVINGSTDCFNTLLSKNADVQLSDTTGRNVLTHAVENNHHSIVSKVLKVVTPNLIDDTVEHLISTRSSKLLCNFANYEEVDLSKFAGVTGFHDKKRQYSALHYACKKGYVTSAEKLIKNGTRLSNRNAKETPLLLAYSQKNLEIISMLLNHGIVLSNNMKALSGFSYWLNGKSGEYQILIKNPSEFQHALSLYRERLTIEDQQLFIIFNRLKEQPDHPELVHLACEKHLTFIECSLVDIPYMPSIKSLALYSTTAESYTNLSLRKIKSLETLTIYDSKLTNLPSNLHECKNLRYLNINNCKRLQHLPTWIKDLPLENLILNDNNLNELPELLPRTLHVLNIQNNNIKKLSPLLAQCEKLTSINLHGNPLVFPELSIAIKSKTSDLLAYLKAFLNNTIPNKTLKISLVGQEQVGKSTLLQAIKSNTGLCEDTSSIIKTDGLEISDVQLRDLNFRIFDLAGDIDFIETHTMFISEGTLFLAVFDLQMFSLSLNTLDPYAFGRIEVWLSSIFAQSPNSRVILIGTHADAEMITSSLLDLTWHKIKTILSSAREAHVANYANDFQHKCLLCSDTSSLNRVSTDGGAGYVYIESSETTNDESTESTDGSNVTSNKQEDNQNMVFPHIVGYFEVSSTKQIPRKVFSNKNTSIEQLKDCIYNTAQDMLSLNPFIPRKWVDLRNYLTKKAEKQFPIITYQELMEVSRECGFSKSDDELSPFLRHYNSCGELLYYFDIDELNDIIIIDPQWLSNQLRAVISFRATHLITEGVIQHSSLEQAWCDIEPLFRSKVLTLFRQAGIFIRLSDDADLVPCRLPVGRPSEDMWAPDSENTENQVSYCFKFNNLPTSFFSHLTSLVESRREEFSVGKMAPVYYSNHIVYFTQSLGIPCEEHTKKSEINLSRLSTHDAVNYLTRGVKLSRFLSLDSDSVQSLLEVGRNSFRISMAEFSDFNEVVLDESESKPNFRHRIHFELLPHLKCIVISIRGPKPCCLAPETIDLLNRVRLTRYNSVHTEFFFYCPICIKKGMQNPSKFTLSELNDSVPICEKGHDSKDWKNVQTGVCEYDYKLTNRQLMSTLNDFDCPKLFLMMPVNLHGVGFREFYTLSYLKEGYSVHLLCEYPDCWHFLTTPGYRITRPREFVKKYGRRLQTMLRVLSKFEIPARIAGLAVESANSLADLLASLKELANDLDEHLSSFSEDWSNFQIRSNLEDSLCYLNSHDGLNRREFRRFLNKADEENRFGDLVPKFVGERIVWLCEAHSKCEDPNRKQFFKS